MKSVPSLHGVPKPLGPYSPCVVANGFVFVSGQAPLAPGAAPGSWAAPDIAGQTRQCLRNVETILRELGLGLESVVKTTVFLRNPQDFAAMNEAYGEFFSADPPARSTSKLGAELAGLLLSIEAIAVYEPRKEG